MTSKSQLELLNSSHQSKVLKAAIFSRFVLFILSILWRTLLAPYDTSASLNPTCRRNPPLPSPLLPSLGSAIENGVIWDSVYFVRIAQCGYEYEQSYAFLPLLPACIFAFSRTVFAPLDTIIGYRAVLALSGYVVCNVAFIFTAMYFYRTPMLHCRLPFCFALIQRPYSTHQYILRACMPCFQLVDATI
ncbi:hypothetical protein ES319_A10G171000v1 [Gossypium barbadense]|uniref:GPI mannosyltransferase 2 n=4 Tax=Gossypium TaxID=3633 RepID=A0A5J5U4R1_GOSBA|nr:hypothetical protein ES319_A10G171000v1 [Gossypium barbadense]TYG99380.1 hypothetical protein ES288_A10G191000v1 [Gossypium darwinii]TYI06882.1 hypothetical protein ES332_A10G189800v1 [Gossypium tomentosum]